MIAAPLGPGTAAPHLLFVQIHMLHVLMLSCLMFIIISLDKHIMCIRIYIYICICVCIYIYTHTYIYMYYI